MKLRNGWYSCDLCHAKVFESQMIPMADGDPFPHVCHNCLLTGWVSYCVNCYHTCLPDELSLEFHCPACAQYLDS